MNFAAELTSLPKPPEFPVRRLHVQQLHEARVTQQRCSQADGILVVSTKIVVFSSFWKIPNPWDPCMVYMVTWIPSIYPSHVSINIPAPWIRHGLSYIPCWIMLDRLREKGFFSHGHVKAGYQSVAGSFLTVTPRRPRVRCESVVRLNFAARQGHPEVKRVGHPG